MQGNSEIGGGGQAMGELRSIVTEVESLWAEHSIAMLMECCAYCRSIRSLKREVCCKFLSVNISSGSFLNTPVCIFSLGSLKSDLTGKQGCRSRVCTSRKIPQTQRYWHTKYLVSPGAVNRGHFCPAHRPWIWAQLLEPWPSFSNGTLKLIVGVVGGTVSVGSFISLTQIHSPWR